VARKRSQPVLFALTPGTRRAAWPALPRCAAPHGRRPASLVGDRCDGDGSQHRPPRAACRTSTTAWPVPCSTRGCGAPPPAATDSEARVQAIFGNVALTRLDDPDRRRDDVVSHQEQSTLEAVRTLGPRLIAHAPHPLLGTGRLTTCPPGLPALESARVHVFPTAEERTKERDFFVGRRSLGDEQGCRSAGHEGQSSRDQVLRVVHPFTRPFPSIIGPARRRSPRRGTPAELGGQWRNRTACARDQESFVISGFICSRSSR